MSTAKNKQLLKTEDRMYKCIIKQRMLDVRTAIMSLTFETSHEDRFELNLDAVLKVLRNVLTFETFHVERSEINASAK